MPRMSRSEAQAAILAMLDGAGGLVPYATFKDTLQAAGVNVAEVRAMSHAGLLELMFAEIDGATVHVVKAVAE